MMIGIIEGTLIVVAVASGIMAIVMSFTHVIPVNAFRWAMASVLSLLLVYLVDLFRR